MGDERRHSERPGGTGGYRPDRTGPQLLVVGVSAKFRGLANRRGSGKRCKSSFKFSVNGRKG